MRATLLLKQNIDTLLRTRHQTRKELAIWCHRTESWISKIFKEPNKDFAIEYLDRIADFFGLATYQLFQPGISPLTERRFKAERRAGRDRRVGTAGRLAASLAATLPVRKEGDRRGLQVVATSPLQEEFHRLAAEYERRLSALISHAASGGQTPDARRALPPAPRGRRGVRGSDSPPRE